VADTREAKLPAPPLRSWIRWGYLLPILSPLDGQHSELSSSVSMPAQHHCGHGSL
jgi:hypothetical protein